VLRIEFSLRGLSGRVEVEVEPNRDPDELGCPPHAEGFPVCNAVVRYAGRGYRAALGWIQLVRSADGSTGEVFEPDPVEALGRVPHPFCWFGFAPNLFDPPSRRSREPLDWTAHSFLAFVADERRVRALLGFSWGFAIRDEGMSLTPPASLDASGWDGHLALFERSYPEWAFDPGYHTG
jgi:hypothetical protein